MVWSSSTDVGLSMVSYQKTIDDKVYECIVLVAVYEPVGNIPGEFENNILPILF
jgi:hypothetical protein